MHIPSQIKRSNMSKLREASRMAMRGRVMMAIDADHLMTLSLGVWQRPEKVADFEADYFVLGVFRAGGIETRQELYLRLYDEAVASGALLAPAEEGLV